MFKNSIKLFKELANEFKQSEERFQEGKERHEKKKRKIREQKKRSGNYQRFIESLVRGNKQHEKREMMKMKRTNKKVYYVRRTSSFDITGVAKGLKDLGEYMDNTGFLDEAGQPLYVGDVVSVNSPEYPYDRPGYHYHTVIVIGERDGKPFAWGYGGKPLKELKLIKTRCVKTIAETYKEQDFVIGDESLLDSINGVKDIIDAYAERLGKELDQKFQDVTTSNIEVIASDEDVYDAFEDMKISDIRNLIEKTTDENIKMKARAFLKELAEG